MNAANQSKNAVVCLYWLVKEGCEHSSATTGLLWNDVPSAKLGLAMEPTIQKTQLYSYRWGGFEKSMASFWGHSVQVATPTEGLSFTISFSPNQMAGTVLMPQRWSWNLMSFL